MDVKSLKFPLVHDPYCQLKLEPGGQIFPLRHWLAVRLEADRELGEFVTLGVCIFADLD